MKPAFYIFLVIAGVNLCSCKGKTNTDPLDSNTFDPNAVGTPLVVDTSIAGVTDTAVSQPSPYNKDDSLVKKELKADTTQIYDETDSTLDKIDSTNIPD